MSKIRAGILSGASAPPGFDAAAFVAAAIVDQDFTGLSSTPGAWEVTGGTEDYNVGGLTQASSTPLAMRLDISGASVNDVPGWLLVNFEYPDVAEADISMDTTNVSGTRRQTAQFHGTGGLDFNYTMHRLETDNVLDCDTGGDSGFQMDNPSANEAWMGVRSYGLGDPSYEDGVMYLVTDIDGAAFGQFSSNDCDQFDPDPVKYVRFTLAGTAAGDITIKRILFWNDFGQNGEEFAAVMAELGFTVP